MGGAAVVAGVGLLIMTVTAPYAEFCVFPKLIVDGDTGNTFANMLSNRALYVSALAAFVLNYLADVVVAWALFLLLAPVNRDIALLAAAFRLIYTALGIGALTNLFAAARMLDQPQNTAAPDSAAFLQQFQLLLDAYPIEWGVALIFFGVHLLIIGYLISRSDYMPRVLGYLVAAAGAGYIVYVGGLYALPMVDLSFVGITFLFEPVLMLWLLLRGRKLG